MAHTFKTATPHRPLDLWSHEGFAAFAVPAAITDDPALDDRSTRDDGVPSFCVKGDSDQAHVLWVEHPDEAARTKWIGGRYLIDSPSGTVFGAYLTDDVAAAVKELKRRHQRRGAERP